MALLAGSAQAQMTLRASHQFPGGKGDIRDDMVQMIAKEAAAANVGLTIQVYPGASLFKPNDQWNAMVNGQLDITLFPLDYASGKAPVFSATLMPGLIRNQDRAKRINASPFMQQIRAEIEKRGVIVLSDAWFAGGMAAKSKCIVKPDDLKGMKFRAAGPTFAAMWEAAGAAIVVAAVERSLQRLPDRHRRRHRHQPRHVRLDPPLRGHRLPHRAGQQRAVVHVRAGADVEEDLRPSQQAAAGRRSSRPARTRRPCTRSRADAENQKTIKAVQGPQGEGGDALGCRL